MMDEPTTSGITLMRDYLLPNLLQEDESPILYWAGKELASQFPQTDFSDVASFFDTSEFGELLEVKLKREKIILQLSGNIVYNRMQELKKPSFDLEAGFLAKQYELIHPDTFAEVTSSITSNKSVEFTIHIESNA